MTKHMRNVNGRHLNEVQKGEFIRLYHYMADALEMGNDEIAEVAGYSSSYSLGSSIRKRQGNFTSLVRMREYVRKMKEDLEVRDKNWDAGIFTDLGEDLDTTGPTEVVMPPWLDNLLNSPTKTEQTGPNRLYESNGIQMKGTYSVPEAVAVFDDCVQGLRDAVEDLHAFIDLMPPVLRSSAVMLAAHDLDGIVQKLEQK